MTHTVDVRRREVEARAGTKNTLTGRPIDRQTLLPHSAADDRYRALDAEVRPASRRRPPQSIVLSADICRS